MDREDRSPHGWAADGPTPAADRRLVEQIRGGDADAGHRFVRDYYPGIYRYLLYLTGSPEAAEDLTQETFLQAWRRLDRFEGRSALRTWLHRIAHREFLQELRSQGRSPVGRGMISLEEAGEVAVVHAPAQTETTELRTIIDKLPKQQRDMVILHHLEGYEYEEIAQILGVSVGRVRHQLSGARARLLQELGEGDLLYLNELSSPMRQWAWLPLDQMHALGTRLSLVENRELEENMERREFLRQAAVSAAGLMLSEPEKDVVDPRLTQKVTSAFKGAALSDLCERLRADTSVHVAAGPSVADEKVTLFCEKTPLREVMRQLSRPFGYTWLRSGTPGTYRYELVQDLRSQLLEEELRNRDRNAALLALDREVERYREFLSLSPVEAAERLRTAPESEKPFLEKLGGQTDDVETGLGWGPIQMYFRLSREEQEALRAGQVLLFTTQPEAGERPLPPEVAQGVLQSYRHWRVNKGVEVWDFSRASARPEDLPLTAVPEVRAGVVLWMTESEPGTLNLDGCSRIFFRFDGKIGAGRANGMGPYATGRSSTAQLQNGRLNARFDAEPALRTLVTIEPQPSCGGASRQSSAASDDSRLTGTGPHDIRPTTDDSKVTPADLLEAVHRATGLPVVGDYYTRLAPLAGLSVRNAPLSQALNQLADAMRLRWTLADRNWLEFRSASYYDDRLKEVPNRLLARWSAARQQRGFLSLDDLVEIAGLPDAPLDGAEMAEGAREIWGLREWELPRKRLLRSLLRDLVLFTPEQRRQAMTAEGLPFVKMSLPQQQQFLGRASLHDPLPLEALSGAALRIEYTRPGEFQWGDPGMVWSWSRWFVIREHGRHGWSAPRPSVRARTGAGVVEALLHLDPAIRDAATDRHPVRAQELATEPPPPVPLEAQIFPTELNLVFIYVPGRSNEYPIHIVHRSADTWQLLF